MINHKKLDAIALKVAQALNSGDSNTATSAAEEYLEEHLSDDFMDHNDGETSPGDLWDNARENLEVGIIDQLVKLVPDDQWNEDEMNTLVTTFMTSLEGKVKDMVIDKVEDGYRESRAYSRNPYGYYGVKPEDF